MFDVKVLNVIILAIFSQGQLVIQLFKILGMSKKVVIK